MYLIVVLLALDSIWILPNNFVHCVYMPSGTYIFAKVISFISLPLKSLWLLLQVIYLQLAMPSSKFWSIWLNLRRLYNHIDIRINPVALVSNRIINKYKGTNSNGSHICPYDVVPKPYRLFFFSFRCMFGKTFYYLYMYFYIINVLACIFILSMSKCRTLSQAFKPTQKVFRSWFHF